MTGVSPKPTFARIVAGTDGSERAEEAVRQAARFAGLFGASLELVYVVDTGRPHGDEVEAEAEAALGRAAGIAGEGSVEAVSRILGGHPADVLVEEAVEHEADLICVGPDAGVLGGAIHVGEVAQHVLQRASCSVLLAREAPLGFPRRIACGVDGSEGSAVTAALAASIAKVAGAELTLVHVVPVFRGHNAEWVLKADEMSPSELAPSVDAARLVGVEPIREMAMGRPERALVSVAHRDGIDLVVLGHRAPSGIARVLLGSVSEHVAHHAPSSVLVARPLATAAGA